MKQSIILLLVGFLFLDTTNYEKVIAPINSQVVIEESRVSIYDTVYLVRVLEDAAQQIGTSSVYLYFVIKHESRFNPQAINPYSNAVGLIQFMPNTLKGMGYKWEDVYNMSFQQQLEVVIKYYKFYSGYNLDHPIKLFLCTFYPYALKVWDNNEYVFGSEKSDKFAKHVTKVNKPLDLNNDGYITMSEYKEYHNKYINL